MIEARADRARNIAARMADLRTKLRELFALVSRLELLLPEADLPELMRSRDMLPGISELKRNNLMKLFYVNALDIMFALYKALLRNEIWILSEVIWFMVSFHSTGSLYSRAIESIPV